MQQIYMNQEIPIKNGLGIGRRSVEKKLFGQLLQKVGHEYNESDNE